ncbi:asparaginase [Aestuariibius insulae]|uniref:asparaginase n=1 Tax=Aestuariibius insulae TaxID=2058287 RepID=UPI00345E07D3
MTQPERLIEIWRGDRVESVHLGHIAICRPDGSLVESWGDPEATIYPRSSCKMLQAVPLLEEGVSGLTTERLALACASHQGAAIHTERVAHWLSDLGLSEEALLCGPQDPADRAARTALIRSSGMPGQIHNNCSGKHAGFLALGQAMGAGPDYIDPDHPVQRRILEAFEETTGETSPGFAIDGCSAPNFATTVRGLARAMAVFASANAHSGARAKAQARLVEAMIAHPDLVAGEGRACTALMRAMRGVAVKTGAEGVFTAILPKQKLGIALKITDGATRAAEAAITAMLIRLGVLDQADPAALLYLDAPIRNRRDLVTGYIRAAKPLH